MAIDEDERTQDPLYVQITTWIARGLAEKDYIPAPPAVQERFKRLTAYLRASKPGHPQARALSDYANVYIAPSAIGRLDSAGEHASPEEQLWWLSALDATLADLCARSYLGDPLPWPPFAGLLWVRNEGGEWCTVFRRNVDRIDVVAIVGWDTLTRILP